MGLIAKIKELFSAERYILKAMEEADRQNAHYAAMTHEALLALPDSDLYNAAVYRLDRKLEALLGKGRKGSLIGRANHLSPPQRLLYLLSEIDADLNCGIHHFLLSESGQLTADVGKLLLEAGAPEHSALFEAFVSAHAVNPLAPADFANNPAQDPHMAAFDDAYEKLPPLEGILTAYIRRQIEEF